MPDDADALVARLAAGLFLGEVTGAFLQRHRPGAGGADGFGHGDIDGVELVVARQLLDDAIAAVILEHDEMPDEIEETPFVEHAAQQHFQLREFGGRDGFAINGAPRHEAFLVRADRADARLQAVGNNQHGVVDEQRRDLLLVGLELRERLPDVGVLIRRILQLDDAQRQAVDENHHVGPPVVLAFDHGELVHHEPVVVVRVGKINQPDDLRADAAIFPPALDGDAVHEQPVKGAVLRDEIRPSGDGDFAIGFVQGFRRQLGIQLPQRGAQPIRQERFAKTGALRLRLAGGDVLSIQHRIIQLPEPT